MQDENFGTHHEENLIPEEEIPHEHVGEFLKKEREHDDEEDSLVENPNDTNQKASKILKILAISLGVLIVILLLSALIF